MKYEHMIIKSYISLDKRSGRIVALKMINIVD